MLDKEQKQYLTRVMRTKALQKEYSSQIEVMLESFLPHGWVVSISKVEMENPGFPFAEKTHYTAMLYDPKKDGSDAHIFAQGYTPEDCQCRLLGIILSNKGFFPFT